MNKNLYTTNTPQSFWQVQEDIPPEAWEDAINQALPKLGMDAIDLASALHLSLGEGQFGPHHWQFSFAKRVYYQLKPLLPRRLTSMMRKVYSGSIEADFALEWPAEARYAQFLWECLRQVLLITGKDTLPFRSFWPEAKQAGFILTHDIETAEGQSFVSKVADLEQQYGFAASFNFIPERYSVDKALMAELSERGFEIGVHGLHHDGKLFFSQKEFNRRAEKINQYLKEFNARGFRTPLTHRNPQWMQSLKMDYDLSFFDSDPYEPIAGGTMSLWPFQIGHFLELPYTLPQDYTLINVIRASGPQLWLDKVDFLYQFNGMILLNTHPDYLKDPVNWQVYENFLKEMQTGRETFWHALPCEAADWWRSRQAASTASSAAPLSLASLKEGQLHIEAQS